MTVTVNGEARTLSDGTTVAALIAELGLGNRRVAVEVNRAIGLTDTIVMLPLFVPAAVGLLRGRMYGAVFSWIVFGMSLYWPVIFWTSEAFYARAGFQHAQMNAAFIIVPALIWAIAAWGSFDLDRNRTRFQ